MYAIYGNIYHPYTPNVSIYTIHGSYGLYYHYIPLYDHYMTIILPLYYHYMTIILPLYYHYMTIILPLYDHYITSR